MEGLQDDMGDGSMQCADHPYKNNIPPGGICAFCLQEKLGKLVSSSFPIAVFPSSSPPSSSPSFRSVRPNGSSSSSSTVNADQSNNSDCHHHHPYYSRRSRIPFLLTSSQKKKKKMMTKGLALPGAAAPEQAASLVFKRSMSTTTPGRRHFMGSDDGENEYISPRKRRFWSFLYLSSSKYSSTARRIDKPNCSKEICYSSTMGSFSRRTTKKEEFAAAAVVVEEEENDDDSPNHQAAFDRKVSRSRSVGCGSRSFSGDFFERISTGFGDCTLRRVESQREGKPKVTPTHRGGTGGGGGQDCIKERVKCGGLFSGFMITSNSSSSSSSSYWVSSSAEDKAAAGGHLAHGRSKSWGWAFASPIRAFSKHSSGRREGSNNNNKNTTPNLNAIPSLLAVRG